MTKKQKITYIKPIFDRIYDNATCSLDYKNPLQLLIATQLAAQCTDARVNIVTAELFKKYKTAHDFANADILELEQDIHATGFFRNKAKNIIGCCQRLLAKYNGIVPNTMDELLTLPGVGRKTANIILGDVYGKPAIVVDTHCIRLSGRIGLTKNTDPAKIEQDLLKIVPPEYSSVFCHQLVYHGRAVCNARKPKCEVCQIAHLCDYFNAIL